MPHIPFLQLWEAADECVEPVPLSRDSGPTPGSCRGRSPASWCRPPPTVGWTQWGSAAPAPCASSLPDTGSGRGGGNRQRAAHRRQIFILFCLRTLEVRSCQLSSPRGSWRRPCTCGCLAGRGDSPADRPKGGYDTNVIKEGLCNMSGYWPPCASPAL